MSRSRDTADWGQFQPVRKNLIINGDSRIWQRGTTFAAATSDFFADRFTWVQAGAGVVTLSRDPATPSGVGRNGHAMKVDVTTADGSIAAGDVYGIRYPIEANDMQHLNIGTSDAKTVTLSFRVASSKTGIHSGSLRNEIANRSYVFEYTVNAASTWETKTVTIDLDTTGTWSVDNNVGMDIFFSIATGTTFQGTVDAWTAGNFVGSSNQVNLMDNTANNFWLTNVQLEVGTEATDFEYRSFSEELALCQRYYYRVDGNQGGTPGYRYGLAGALQMYGGLITFPTTMRDIPTVTDLTVLSFNNSSAAAWVTTKEDASIRVTVTASAKYRVVVNDTEFDAEL